MARNNRNRPQSALSGAIRNLASNPRETIGDWYESYFRHQTWDYKFLVSLIVLMVGFGVVMVLSSSNVDSIKATGNPFGSFSQQFIFALLGLAVMFFMSTRSIDWIEVFGQRLFFVSLVAQCLVRVPGLGVSAGGNSNWLNLGFTKVQPSEFLKLGLILFMAGFLSKHIDELWDWRRGGFPAMVAGFGTAGLVYVLGNDLGTAGVMLVVMVALIFLVGLPSNHIGRIVMLMGAGLAIAAVSNGSRIARIMSFLNPNGSDDGAAWQSTHGTWALASGGITGTGLGQAKLNWGWIPEVENDFIFAVIGEEWGLIGAVVVLALFFLLFIRLRKVATNSNDTFASIATLGIALWIILQALINIAVVLQWMPVLGVPLPLISKGGSSLLSILAGLGIVLAVERNRQPMVTRAKRK